MGKKRGRKIADPDIAAAAYWRVTYPDMPISLLAQMLHMNVTALKNRVAEARKRQWIDHDWIFKQASSQLHAVLAKASDHPLEEAIRKDYGRKQLPELTVVPVWPPKGASATLNKKEIEDTNRCLVAHRAAQIVLERLPRMKDIGLSYGRTLRMTVDKLEHYSAGEEVPPVAGAPAENRNPNDPSPPSSQNAPERTIYTIMGALSFRFADPRHGDYLEYSASHLTNRLAKILGANCKRYFLDTPVYVPLAFLDEYSSDNPRGMKEGEALEIAAKFVKHIPTYHDLFENGDGSAINRIDTVISSVGDLETGFGTIPSELAPFLRDHEKKALLKEAVGDIAGRYVAKDGETGEKGTTIANVNSRIFGLGLHHLESIAERAEKNRTPGVIVIAASPAKAKVIFALLNRPRKVISELIISGDLAEELLKLCKNGPR